MKRAESRPQRANGTRVYWLCGEQPPSDALTSMKAVGFEVVIRPLKGLEPAPRLWWVAPAPRQAGDHPDLADHKVGVLHTDAGAADGIAQALRTANAEVALVSATAPSLERLHNLNPDVLVLGQGDLEDASQGTLRGIWAHPTLRWTPVVVCPDRLFGSGGAHAPELRHLAFAITQAAHEVRRLSDELARIGTCSLPLSQLGPVRPLSAFQDSGLGLRIAFDNPALKLEIDVAQGIVAGAQGAYRREPGRKLLGTAALTALLEQTSGTLRARKVERPAQTNIMSPLDTALVAVLAEMRGAPVHALQPGGSGGGAEGTAHAAPAPPDTAARPAQGSAPKRPRPKPAFQNTGGTLLGPAARALGDARTTGLPGLSDQALAAMAGPTAPANDVAATPRSASGQRPEAVTVPVEREHLLGVFAGETQAPPAPEVTAVEPPVAPAQRQPVAAPRMPPLPPREPSPPPEAAQYDAAAIESMLRPTPVPRWIWAAAAAIVVAGAAAAAVLLLQEPAPPGASAGAAAARPQRSESAATEAVAGAAAGGQPTEGTEAEGDSPSDEGHAAELAAATAMEGAEDAPAVEDTVALAEDALLVENQPVAEDDEPVAEDEGLELEADEAIEEELGPEEAGEDDEDLEAELGPEEGNEEDEIADLGANDPIPTSRRARVRRASNLVDHAHRRTSAKRYAEARLLYLRALRMWPQYPRALGGLAEAYLGQQNYPAALRTAKRAVRMRPRRASYRLNLGDAYAGLGQTERAKTAWRRALRRGAKKQALVRLRAVDKKRRRAHRR